MTIAAASIPVLRVLVRDVASTTRKYYGGSNGTRTGRSQIGGGITRTNTVTVTTTRKPSVRRKDKLADDRSDKSILGDEEEVEFGKIVKTNEVVVQYDTRSDYDGHNESYEMGRMDRMDRMNRIV